MKNADLRKIKIVEISILLAVLFLLSFTFPEIKTYKNLNANKTAYFSFSKGSVVSEKDSWDVSFNHTSLLVKNSAQVLNASFDKTLTAPKEGYSRDTPDKKAIPDGSGNGWYKYSMMDHSIHPLPDKVLLIKTEEQKIIKLEILSYYKDLNGESGYYTFRYSFLGN